MKKVALCMFLNFVVMCTYAQVDSSKRVAGDVIQYTRSGFWVRTTNYTIGGIPATRKEVSAKIAAYPASLAELKKYNTYFDLTLYTCAAAVSTLLAFYIVNGNNNAYNKTSSKVLLGVGCAFIIPEAIFAGARNRHYKKMFRTYNQQFNK